ncbi:hypothetical protein BK133_01785 [Paenibacillus sp. FSL H8-0548]|uniref:serine/threonine-protein kinase n=1 Tax=Paenibacillus sp. FSL H8-0548 TaxID=1920422 RepID=UPI00096C79AE|nr:serine/threonine-protein kinase [Paenibacillus sp. FSL H8-0548]OMF38283.1 hypothetical protein BK133_01785 [Paenibacillus sp. FSL H8-0548]
MGKSVDQFASYTNGTVLESRYRIIGELGRGGMGVVYLAEDRKLGNKLRAIKVLAKTVHNSSTQMEEAMLMIKISHPHLPLIMDCFYLEDAGCEALVMEYIEGHTMAELLQRSKSRVPFSRILNMAGQLCSALNHLHSCVPPIIHRDLKPSNVMIDKNGDVKLIDFGISRQFKEGQQQDTVQLGTHGFAAPEQEGSGQSDHRTDIYGLGALLFYLCSGGRSFQRSGGSTGEMEQFNCFQHDVPQPFRMMLLRSLQSDPHLRYGTISEFEQALKPLVRSNSPRSQAADHRELTAHNPVKPIRVCLLSLAPGAGATFLTHTLAELLGRRGVHVAAAEYEQARPEWHAWFSDQQRTGDYRQQEGSWFDKRFILHSGGKTSVQWFFLHPEQQSRTVDQEQNRFEQMLWHAGGMIQLIDLSSRWSDQRALQLLKEAAFVFVIADPAVSKWQANDLRRLFAIKQELAASGGNLMFIANKDIDFKGRTEWLSLFPELPLAIIPSLSAETLLSLHYNGKWATDDARIHKRLNRALLPVFRLLYDEINTG